MSKMIKLHLVTCNDRGEISSSHIKSSYNINSLFHAINYRPEADSDWCIDLIKKKGDMFVYLSKEFSKFHHSREELMREVLTEQCILAAMKS